MFTEINKLGYAQPSTQKLLNITIFVKPKAKLVKRKWDKIRLIDKIVFVGVDLDGKPTEHGKTQIEFITDRLKNLGDDLH